MNIVVHQNNRNIMNYRSIILFVIASESEAIVGSIFQRRFSNCVTSTKWRSGSEAFGRIHTKETRLLSVFKILIQYFSKKPRFWLPMSPGIS